jgi:hypothetical protein
MTAGAFWLVSAPQPPQDAKNESATLKRETAFLEKVAARLKSEKIDAGPMKTATLDLKQCCCPQRRVWFCICISNRNGGL